MKQHNHDGVWLADLIDYRLAEMKGTRQTTLTLKHSLASAQTLAKNLRATETLNSEMLEALKALFANCCMVHRHWGEGDNTKQADAAIKSGILAIAHAEGKNMDIQGISEALKALDLN